MMMQVTMIFIDDEECIRVSLMIKCVYDDKSVIDEYH